MNIQGTQVDRPSVRFQVKYGIILLALGMAACSGTLVGVAPTKPMPAKGSSVATTSTSTGAKGTAPSGASASTAASTDSKGAAESGAQSKALNSADAIAVDSEDSGSNIGSGTESGKTAADGAAGQGGATGKGAAAAGAAAVAGADSRGGAAGAGSTSAAAGAGSKSAAAGAGSTSGDAGAGSKAAAAGAGTAGATTGGAAAAGAGAKSGSAAAGDTAGKTAAAAGAAGAAGAAAGTAGGSSAGGNGNAGAGTSSGAAKSGAGTDDSMGQVAAAAGSAEDAERRATRESEERAAALEAERRGRVETAANRVVIDQDEKLQTLGGTLPATFNMDEKGQFEFDRYELSAETKSKLEEIAHKLNEAPYDRIIVHGYTDRIGTDDYNQQLSEKRAWAVAGYLMDKGVPPYKLTVVGRGKIAPLTTPEECKGLKRDALIDCLQRDRRVEVVATLKEYNLKVQ